MAKEDQAVANAQTALSAAVTAARAAGYNVSFQTSGGGDPMATVTGGPEPVAEKPSPDHVAGE